MTVRAGGRPPGRSRSSASSTPPAAATALFSTKEKFGALRALVAARHRPLLVDEDQAALVRTRDRRPGRADRAFTFLHVSLPDRFGHEYGGMSRAVPRRRAPHRPAARQAAREPSTRDPALRRPPRRHPHRRPRLHARAARRTAPKVLANYRIPFVVWGAGVRTATSTRLNPDYRDPGTTRPTYAAEAAAGAQRRPRQPRARPARAAADPGQRAGRPARTSTCS